MFPNLSKIAYRQEFQSSWSTSHRSCLCDSDFSSSLGLFLLVLGASELLVYLICKRMACYADNAFNSQGLDWTTSSESHEQPHTKNLKRSMIKKWLKLSKYFTSGQEEDFCCPICLGDYDIGETVAKGPCSHSFHERCILQWLEKHVSCPCCRRPIVLNDEQENTGQSDFELQYFWFSPPILVNLDPSFFLFMY